MSLVLRAIGNMFAPDFGRDRNSKGRKQQIRRLPQPEETAIQPFRLVQHQHPQPVAPQRVALPPPKKTPIQTFEESIWKAIMYAWWEAATPLEKSNPGSCKIEFARPQHKSSTVTFTLVLTGKLPTPQVKAMVDNAFILALHAALDMYTQDRQFIDRCTARLVNRTVEITVPRPGQKPSVNLRDVTDHLPKKESKEILIGLSDDDIKVRASLIHYQVLLSVGMTQTGKTSNLLAILGGLMITHSPDELHVYICAAKPDDWLQGFTDLPHVRGYAVNDPDKTERVVRKVASLIEKHGQIPKAQRPLVIFVLDDMSYIVGWDNFNLYAPKLQQITQTGGAIGIKTFITSHDISQESVGRASFTKNAGIRIATQMQSGATYDPMAQLAKNLGVPESYMKGMHPPKMQEEVCVAFAGQPPYNARSIWVTAETIHDIVMEKRHWTTHTHQNPTQPINTHNGHPSTPINTHNHNQPSTNIEGGLIHQNPTNGTQHPIHNSPGAAGNAEDGIFAPVAALPAHRNGQNGRMQVEAPISEYRRDGGNGHHAPSRPDPSTIIDRDEVPPWLRKKVLEEYHYTCAHCGGQGTEACDPNGDKWNVDHLEPVAHGGETKPENLVASCSNCNHQKGSKTMLEFNLMRIAKLRQPVSKIQKNDSGHWAPTSWQKIHIWACLQRGDSISALVTAQGLNSGRVNKKFRQWGKEGGTMVSRLRKIAQSSPETAYLVEELDKMKG